MKDLRPVALLLAFLFSGVIGLFVAASFNMTTPPPHVMVVAGDPLTEAIKSAVMIHFVDSTGTGVLIGRKKLENGNWRYAVMTAYHVVDSIRERLVQEPENEAIIKQLVLVYQEHFHAPLTKVRTSVVDFEWMIPNMDWAIIIVDLPVKLPCAQLATRQEFESIQPYDHIYGVGSDGSDGLFFREGVIASTNGTQPFIDAVEYPWDSNQDAFFRAYHGIFYGASGGPVFSRQGKIIGIYNGFVHLHRGSPVTNVCIVAKAHLATEALVHSNITIVEN